MSGTAEAETTAILALLATAGTVLDGVRDDTETPKNWSGAPTPYMVPLFLPPVPSASGRSLGVSEKGQPQVFPFQVTYVGYTQAEVRALRVAGDKALIGVSPNSLNATEIKGVGSRIPPTLNVAGVPSSARLIRYYECKINAEVDELS